MKTSRRLVLGALGAMALWAQSALASDAQLRLLADQLHGRTARLVFDTSGYFADADNFRSLDQTGRAMLDSAASLTRLLSAADFRDDHVEKDLNTLQHYRVTFSKEFDVLELKLKDLWLTAYAGSFVEEDVAIIRFRLGTIAALANAMDDELHGVSTRPVPACPDLSSRPGGYCPPSGLPDIGIVFPWPGTDDRDSGPPAGGSSPGGSGGSGAGPLPPDRHFPTLPPGRIPDVVVPRVPLPDTIRPGRRIPGLDGLAERLTPPGGAGGGGSGGRPGAGGSGVGGVDWRSLIGPTLSPETRNSILRGLGSAPRDSGSRGSSGRGGIPGVGGIPGSDGPRIPGIGR